METVETDDQSLEFLNLNESSYEPSFHDIYDEMANLERWQEMLNEMLNNENISLEGKNVI